MRRMMSEVPKADVVITNPTHYAVAITYDEELASAPYIVAMGVDQVALKIKEVAKANDVMTVENRELARNLYDTLEIGDVIPEEFYQAVAEILAYVYRVENKV
ncbi:MAG TPA: EscU/YscU/HrcU family type III secretion system export apparatus switch protein, partial [Bacillota bacterium]|nr:EscU/YscU/HrcU family type III secretion system export apparatus switch protein [Bacillota bacterium]